MDREDLNYNWTCSVPIFSDPLIVKQLIIAVGLPFGVVLLVIAVFSRFSRDGLYAIAMILGLLFLTWLFVKMVNKGRYEVEYWIDASGVRCKYTPNQLKKNQWINGLTVFLGLLSGKPTVAGAGILAQSRQDVSIKWNRIQSVKHYPRHRRIHLSAGWFETVVVYCSDEAQYKYVCKVIESKCSGVSQ